MFDVKDKKLRTPGKERIEWALQRMPVLELIRKRFSKEKPFKGVSIGACLHVTTETAGLMLALKAGGAKVRLCASNPLSTQDDVASSLVYDYGVEVCAINGEDKKTYYEHIEQVLSLKPEVTLDDGADLVSTIHKERTKNKSAEYSWPWGSTEETTTGVIRLRALEQENKLLYPVIAVNDAYTKHLFDNRYGTGQSTVDGIIRATNKLISGSMFVVCGYGWCGKGVAMRAKGFGANVVVVETNPLNALEAAMDGFTVLPIKKAAKVGDIFVTTTGDMHVIRKEHFAVMKDKAVVSNAGHFNVELDLDGLKKLSTSKKEVKPLVDRYTIKGKGKDSKRIYVLAEGRLVNLACAEGHPAEVMDLSFANQALSSEFIVKENKNLGRKVYTVPEKIDKQVAKLKLKTLGISIDKLTPEQKKYLSSWESGT